MRLSGRMHSQHVETGQSMFTKICCFTILVELIGLPIANARQLTHQQKFLVIAHRGASGYIPDHTLEGYRLAMKMGADFIETDLVNTKDGYLVARHEPNIITTTDVIQHSEFKSRKKSKKVDGIVEEGFFAEDFTFAELKMLHAIQPLSSRNQSFNGRFKIPTFDEIIQEVQDFEQETGRKVGIYIETKHPTYFRDQALPLEEKLIKTLISKKFTDEKRIFLQSFEVGNLREIISPLMKANNLNFPLIQLMGDPSSRPYDFIKSDRKETYADLASASGLKDIVAKFAAGIGPWKGMTGMSNLVARAHSEGLLVHPYTFRNEEQNITKPYRNTAEEYQAFFRMGVDGVFTDFTDIAVRERFLFELGNGK